jgi:hypothetical protein
MAVLVALRETTGRPITQMLSQCVKYANTEAIKKQFPPKKMDKKIVKGIEEQDLGDITEIDDVDGGILQYVRRQMHCETVTLEVRREAAAFQREMDRMSGW